MGLPAASIRMISEQAFFNCATALVRWIEGPKPYLDQLIFERSSPSCYSGDAFTAVVNRSRGGIVLAGFAGESACRSTPVDAFHRNHKATSLCDASASHALDETPTGDVHRAISKISGICADVFKTDDWIKQTLPRNLGYGKNTGG
jgi:isochorismate hydrolase